MNLYFNRITIQLIPSIYMKVRSLHIILIFKFKDTMAFWIMFLICVISTDTSAVQNGYNKTNISATSTCIHDDQEQCYLEFRVSEEEMDLQMMIGDLRNVRYHVQSNIHGTNQLSVLFSTSIDEVVNITSPNPELVTLTKHSHTFSVDILAVQPGQTELKIHRAHDLDIKDVEYIRTHSLVHISVYKSDVWFKIALGLGYTFAIFSIFGFFPQVIFNQVRKSVAGFDLAFLIMEVLDTLIYLIYTVGLYFGISLQEQYLDRNESQILPVAWYDVMFSIVTMTIFILLVIQYVYFGDGDKNVSNSSKVWLGIVVLCIVTLIVLAMAKVISWFELFMYVPWVRLFIAVFKYVPQIITNYSLKSISGLSIFMVLIEFLVGFAVVGQMTIDVINYNDESLLVGNFSKFFDGFCTFSGNLAFIIQFILWHGKDSSQNQFLMFRKMFAQIGTDKSDGYEKMSLKENDKSNQKLPSYGGV